MQKRTLSTGQEVSVISVGSWQTFERIPFEDSVAVLDAAISKGINFFDTARYGMVPPNERGESQPIPPGSPFAEIIFGRAMAATGAPRESYVLSNKLWFDTYPEQSFIEQADASVLRMGLDYIDVVFVQVPPPGLDIPTLAREVGRVITEGRARTWGTINWSPAQLREAWRVANDEGFPGPSLVELKYSVVRREPTEVAEYQAVYDELGVRVHGSNVFEGGLLTGKYTTLDEIAEKRILPEDVNHVRERFIVQREEYLRAAAEFDVSPVVLALGFVVANPHVASALIGATRPEHIDENVRAVEFIERVGAGVIRARLASFAEASQNRSTDHVNA